MPEDPSTDAPRPLPKAADGAPAASPPPIEPSHPAPAPPPTPAAGPPQPVAPASSPPDSESPGEVPSNDIEPGALLHFEEGEALEARDRKHSGPGGEPDCPRCGTTMCRSVEQHPGPRSDDSPFRVRLVCGSDACAAWTAYNW